MIRIVLVAVVAWLSVPAYAQSALPVTAGERARVTATDGTHVGRIVEVAAGSLRVSIDGATAISIATPSIRTVEISRGRQSKAKRYAIRGAIVAGLVGAVSLGLQHESVGEDGSSVGKAAALGAFSGGLFGGLIGGAIGASKRADRWEHVWP